MEPWGCSALPPPTPQHGCLSPDWGGGLPTAPPVPPKPSGPPFILRLHRPDGCCPGQHKDSAGPISLPALGRGVRGRLNLLSGLTRALLSQLQQHGELRSVTPGEAGMVPGASRGTAWLPPAMGTLLLLLGVLVPCTLLRAQTLPRIVFTHGDPRRPLTLFREENVSHYDALLLGAGEEQLFVGARDRVLSLAVGTVGTMRVTASITWGPTAEKSSECAFKKKSQETECFNFIRVLVALNQSHLYVCGTYAFSPACSYIHLANFTLVPSGRGQPLLDGKGQCPFDPQHTHTALLVDGELYAGTMNNFQGNEPIISRSLGTRTQLKTDAFLRWLSADAAFVASFSAPDDDKVYFFFEETAEELDFFERVLVPRVARVCKSDVGGDKVLQKKWTTFLKAQLLCAQPGGLPFNVLLHASALPRHDGRADIYGLFTSQWQEGRGSSAICSYSQEALEEVFEGEFRELNKETSHWTIYGGPDINPRPGSCQAGPWSDKALTFMKDHFLMGGRVLPTRGRPLLLQDGVTYTRIAVTRAHSASGATYPVLFLATAQGSLHKVVELPAGPHIVESIQLLGTAEGVTSLLLAPGKGVLYVSYSRGVLQVPLANCSAHQSCAECVLARDPYCAWHSLQGSCQSLPPEPNIQQPSPWVQDVERGSPGSSCHRGRSLALPRAWGAPEDPAAEELSAPPHTLLRLPCPGRSALATYNWQQPDGQEASVLLANNTLLVVAGPTTAGTYRCVATENGYSWPVAQYRLRNPTQGAPAPGVPAGSPPCSYWAELVTVTVLLALSLAVATSLALLALRGRLKARSKVRGCGSPPAQHREKVPLNGATTPEPQVATEGVGAEEEEEEEDEGARGCCLQVDGGDTASNRVPVGATE